MNNSVFAAARAWLQNCHMFDLWRFPSWFYLLVYGSSEKGQRVTMSQSPGEYPYETSRRPNVVTHYPVLRSALLNSATNEWLDAQTEQSCNLSCERVCVCVVLVHFLPVRDHFIMHRNQNHRLFINYDLI